MRAFCNSAKIQSGAMVMRSWLVICWLMVWVMGGSAQTPEQPPSIENPLLTIENGVLTIDDGVNVSVPLVWDDELTAPVIYEQVLYQGSSPVIVGRVDDGTENFLFATPIYRDEPVREREIGWHLFIDKYPASRLFDIQVNEDGIIAYLAIIGEDYRTLSPNGCCFPEEYLGKLIVYLRAEGTYTVTPPLKVSITPDGEIIYPTLWNTVIELAS
jgi:hypothetical protein